MADAPWYRRDPGELERATQEVAEVQPHLAVIDAGDTILLRGTFDLKAAPPVQASFEIEIEPARESPRGIPIVREIGGRIPSGADPHHVNSDGTLCVVLPDAYWFQYPGGLTLAGFLESPLRGHLAGQELVLRGEEWPAGEWAHGAAGIRQFYEELLRTTDGRLVTRLLDLTARSSFPALLECPCRSHRTVRDCHGPVLLKLRERLPQSVRRIAWHALRDEQRKRLRDPGNQAQRAYPKQRR